MKSCAIKDFQITTSSVLGLNCYRCDPRNAAHAQYARLGSIGNGYEIDVWMADNNDRYPWVEVDLLVPHNVSGVIVQGILFNYYYHLINYIAEYCISFFLELFSSLWFEFEGFNSQKSNSVKIHLLSILFCFLNYFRWEIFPVRHLHKVLPSSAQYGWSELY